MKIKFNKRYNLKEKAAHPSINTKKEKDVPPELRSPEREGGNDRVDTELVSSLTFHNNRIVDAQFWQLFQIMATNNNWSEERQGRSIPLYLDKSALFYFNSFPEQTESNQRLLKQALRILGSSSSYFRNCTHQDRLRNYHNASTTVESYFGD